MKTIRLLVAAIFLSTVVLTGCSKKNEENNQPPPSGCRIISVNDQTSTFNFTFDGRNRVATMAQTPSSIEEYTYNGDTVIIVRKKAGAFESRKIIVNNAQGMVKKLRIETNFAGTSGSTTEYNYNGAELAQSIQTPIGVGAASVTLYTWVNGNMTEIKSGSLTTKLEYILDKPSSPGNYLEVLNLIQGYTTFRTKNLVKLVSSGSVPAVFTYTFDNQNNVISILSSQSNTANITLTQQCN